MPSLGERIRKSRQQKGWSQSELAKKLNITRNAVSLWEGDVAEPKSGNLRKLSQLFDVDHNWLAHGMARERPPAGVEGLRVVGDIAAGIWHEVVETQDMEYERVPAAPDKRFPVEAQFALRVRGNSVNRIAADGDIVHCVEVTAGGIEIRDRDLVVVERKQAQLTETTIKRVRKANGALELWPESDDPHHQEKLAYKPQKGAGEVVIKALVLWVFKQVPRGS